MQKEFRKNKNQLKLTFYSGTESVTGANFLLEDDKTKILIDCGLTQGIGFDFKNDPNRKPFSYDPREVDFLLVTHAHTDHIGRIPKLIKDGFSGQIFSTKQTKEIAELMFDDALSILNNEAKKHDAEPLYEKKHVDGALSIWQTYDYHQVFDLNEDFSVSFRDAGHILGSAMITVRHKDTAKNIVFTGDLGNTPTPLIRNTEEIEDADYLIMESVYGDRNHDQKEQRKEKLKEILQKIIDRKGTLLIPVFSLEKTQVILHEMNDLVEGKQITSVPVFFDSPLGIRLTEIYQKQYKNFNEKVQARIMSGDDIFDFPKLTKTYTKEESQLIRKTPGPKIIIASSGMSTGGRILYHEKEYLPDPKNAILFIGYQVPGSIGRAIEEGIGQVKIENQIVPIKAQIYTVSGYSSHKDSDNLVDFVSNTAKRVKKVFVVMGEPKSAMFLAQKLRDNLDVDAIHPREGDSFII
ncbi:MAG TPA: MBL fold metallo-hydrolase [Candidatus Paceibacterota bacterium]|nr:MBL fold metallo-hydrolase [Candidatus Paceibacterota bacterium]HMP19133.1 MBL fold metallo-hydrolase [Candidatus Paceibacterota bacterium]HMP85158.1 MBL fold metallo-hydrolase [Candidatus Paceibacterota bacterium]